MIINSSRYKLIKFKTIIYIANHKYYYISLFQTSNKGWYIHISTIFCMHKFDFNHG